jgi:hypothetical protein
MKKFLLVSFMMLAVLGLFAQERAFIRDFSGKVEVQPPGKGWEPAARNLLVQPGATISTGFNSYATIDLGSSKVDVKPLTRMTLAELTKKEGQINTSLNLRVGRVRAEVQKTEGLQHNFSLKSPVSTAAVRGTKLDFNPIRVRVIEGLIAYSNAVGQSRSVAGGEESSVKGNSRPASAEQALIATSATTITTTPAGPAAAPKTTKSATGATLKVTVQ